MSNPGSLALSSKLSSAKSSQTAVSPGVNSVSQTQQFFQNDTSSARRSNAPASATPRNQQTSKSKHKSSKKFRALDEDENFESFSMQNPHGRRGQQSITHLMQFALPPRPNAQQQYHRHSYNGPRRGGGGRGNTWGLGSGYHAMDKARYIHANYRFVVDPRGDYQAQAQDADVHLDWTNVLQIIASSQTQSASCPICLGEPTAPRMAKCGHIFCLPCLIRYMHSEDTSGTHLPEKKARSKKCPICYDSVYVSETRPVRWYTGQEIDTPREGDDVVLRLVKRRPGSTLAMPRESADTVAKGDDVPWYFAAEVMDYARVMKGSEEYMLKEYDEAVAAIQMMEREDELMFGEDTEWTGRAIRVLKEAKEKVLGMGNPPAQPKKPEPVSEEVVVEQRPPIQFNENEDGVPQMYLQKHVERAPSRAKIAESEEEQSETASNPAVGSIPRTLTEMRQRQLEPRPQPNEYLYYHGLLHYYLSPLDIRILKSAFGSYSNFPSSILPRVERVSSGHIVDDELRKKTKYLSHLPYGCEVGFLECDWRDVVPERTLAEFKTQLDRRRERNNAKANREEKERVRIEKEADREIASLRRGRRPSIQDSDGFFSGSGVVMPALGEDGATPPNAGSGHQRPGFGSLASPGTSPMHSRTVWGTAAIPGSSPETHAKIIDGEDGWLQGWENDLLDQRQDAALAASLEEASLQEINKPLGGGGKKGKKGKKITLMSTGGARRGA